MRDNPTNIDLLNIGNCRQNCSHCFYQEAEERCIHSFGEELNLIEKIKKNYPNSALFLYLKNIDDSPEYIRLLRGVNQKSILSNGLNLTDAIIAKLIEVGVESVKISLFANAEQQEFFYKISSSQYLKIKDAIKRCVNAGLKVVVNTIITKETVLTFKDLCAECAFLGVSKIILLRLIPTGNASAFNPSVFIEYADMFTLVSLVEEMKKKYPKIYFSFQLNFGPNFYGKTIEEAKEKVSKGKTKWTRSPYFCPAIDENYYGISLKSGHVYWCFFLMAQPEISKIGYFDFSTSKVVIDRPVDMSAETLRKKLRGNCSSDNCKYQEICLGGCRNAAFNFAKQQGEKNPLYAGMDICMTKIYNEYANQSKK